MIDDVALYDNRDKYKQLEYADYASKSSHLAIVFFNRNCAYYALKADAKNGWIETYVPVNNRPMRTGDLAKKLLIDNNKWMWISNVFLNRDQNSVMVIKLYGEVVIIKLDREGNPVKNGRLY